MLKLCFPWLISALITGSSCLVSKNTCAHEMDIDLRGEAEIQLYHENETVMHEQIATNYMRVLFESVGRLGLFGDHAINYSYRASLDDWGNKAGEQKFSSSLDELYMYLPTTEMLALTIGKERSSQGVGLFYNPTDFLNKEKEADFSKSEDDRRLRLEGSNLVKMDLIDQSWTYTAILASYDSGNEITMGHLVYGSTAYYEGTFYDASMSLFGGDFGPKIGINLSSVAGVLELHGEFSLETKSNRQQIRNNTSGELELYIHDDDAPFVDLLVGATFVTQGSTDIMIEYYHLGNGYSDSEWDAVLSYLAQTESALINNPSPQNSAQYTDARNLITLRTLRKNYFAGRVQHQDIVENVNIALSGVIGLDDNSFTLSPSVEIELSDYLSLIAKGNIYRGNERSEFGSFSIDNDFYFSLRGYF